MQTLLEMGRPQELQGRELWRRQCARNVMDCYALGMEALSGMREDGKTGRKALEGLTRLMVEGMTVVRTEEDEKVFYRIAATLCRECAKACGESENARLFRIYAAIFGDM
jgi:hypothetical protein